MPRPPRPVRARDLLEFSTPEDPRVAPDGESVVWVERRIDPESGATRAALMRGGPHRSPSDFTAGDDLDGSPRFSPDGSRIAFLRTRRPDDGRGRPRQALCVIATDGGEARPLVWREGSFGPPAWSPDGRRVVLAFRAADPLPEGEDQPLSIRVTRLHYKLDGQGFLPRDRFSLYTVDVDAEAPTLEPLTDPDGDWDDLAPSWSPDGRHVAFVAQRRDDRDRDVGNADLWVVPATGGPARQLTRLRGPVAHPTWAPSGRWLAFVGGVGPRGQYLWTYNARLYAVDADGAAPERCLTADLDRATLNLTLDDVWGLTNQACGPAFAPDGRRLFFPVSDEGTTWIGAVDVDDAGHRSGPVRRVVDHPVIHAFSVARGAPRMAVLTTSPTEPGRIETLDLDGADRRSVAWPFERYCAEVALVEPRELRIPCPGGHVVQGWLLVPPGPGPFPMLLDIHGGPIVQFGRCFFHELQWLCALGYAVLYVNPRGSRGYGDAFAGAIHRDWGGPAFEDLMATVDHVLADPSSPVDPARMGVLGGSYGGYMTTWTVGHTDRFAAACTQRTVASFDAMLRADFGFALADSVEALPWEDPELYRRLAPLTYADRIRTPMLVLQGLEDQRTPADQGERLYTTLRLMGQEAELVLFPGANHDLSRAGRPAQRLERLRVIAEWFSRHLGGAATDPAEPSPQGQV